MKSIRIKDNMDEQRRALNNFWNRAADLAESVQRNIKDDGTVDDTTVLALHEFQKAANQIANFMDLLNMDKVNLLN